MRSSVGSAVGEQMADGTQALGISAWRLLSSMGSATEAGSSGSGTPVTPCRLISQYEFYR